MNVYPEGFRFALGAVPNDWAMDGNIIQASIQGMTSGIEGEIYTVTGTRRSRQLFCIGSACVVVAPLRVATSTLSGATIKVEICMSFFLFVLVTRPGVWPFSVPESL